MNRRLVALAVAACALMVGCEHYRQHRMHMDGTFRPMLDCNGASCDVNVAVLCTDGPWCIDVPPTVHVRQPGAVVLHFKVVTAGFQLHHVAFGDAQEFNCSDGPAPQINCTDQHRKSGGFKYEIAIVGVSGPPLDPYVVND